jgi:hypothetical protein
MGKKRCTLHTDITAENSFNSFFFVFRSEKLLSFIFFLPYRVIMALVPITLVNEWRRISEGI